MGVAVHDPSGINIEMLNKDIEQFPQVHPVTSDMKTVHKGVSRLVMLDRYSFKDTERKTLKEGDFVVLTVKEDPKFPARGLGYIVSIDWEAKTARVRVEDEFKAVLDKPKEAESGIINRSLDVMDKPLEVFMSRLPSGMQQGSQASKRPRKSAWNPLRSSIRNFPR